MFRCHTNQSESARAERRLQSTEPACHFRYGRRESPDGKTLQNQRLAFLGNSGRGWVGLALVGAHIGGKALKQIVAVLRAGGGFRVILHAEHGLAGQRDAAV